MKIMEEDKKKFQTVFDFFKTWFLLNLPGVSKNPSRPQISLVAKCRRGLIASSFFLMGLHYAAESITFCSEQFTIVLTQSNSVFSM